MNKRIYFVAFLFLTMQIWLFAGTNSKKSIQKVEYNNEKQMFTCQFKQYKREFILCLPQNFENWTPEQKKQVSPVLMLHGAGENALAFKNMTHFDEDACSRNFAVIYVNGTSKAGSKGALPGWQFMDDKQSKDDYAFLVALIKYMQINYGLNKKAYAVGFSNGGFMCNKLAALNTKPFDAIASVGGMMPKNAWEKRSRRNRIRFIQINGTKDEVVPMKLNGSSKYNPNPAMEDVIEYFKQTSGDKNAEWILLQDGRHVWPTKEYSKIDVNNTILDFFTGRNMPVD